MDAPFPNIPFSISEFEEAGLLCGPELVNSEMQAQADLPAGDSHSYDERVSASLYRTVLPASFETPAPSPSPQSSYSSYPANRPLEQILLSPPCKQTLHPPPQQQPQPTPAPVIDTKRKKQLNCKHQKTFRERQKVSWYCNKIMSELCCECCITTWKCTQHWHLSSDHDAAHH